MDELTAKVTKEGEAGRPNHKQGRLPIAAGFVGFLKTKWVKVPMPRRRKRRKRRSTQPQKGQVTCNRMNPPYGWYRDKAYLRRFEEIKSEEIEGVKDMRHKPLE